MPRFRRFGTAGLLALTLVLVGWGVRLVHDVRLERRGVASNVRLVNRLIDLEHTIHEIDWVLTSPEPVPADELERLLELAIRQSEKATSFDHPLANHLLTEVDLLRSASGSDSVERIHAARRAGSETHKAILAVRDDLTAASRRLGVYWRWLAVLAASSIALAMLVVIKLYRRRLAEEVHLRAAKAEARAQAAETARVEVEREMKAREAAQLQLLESERRYELATAAASVGIWDWNLETDRFYLDPNVKRLLGYTDNEIPNDLGHWSRHIHPDDRKRVEQEIAAHLSSTKNTFASEHRMLHKDGSTRWILARGTSERSDSGKVLRMIGTDTDISERKRLEIEREELHHQVMHAQKLKSLGVLAGGVAHDFNNLLTSILGGVNLALGALPARSCTARRQLELVETSAQRAADLTGQLLAYSGKGSFIVEALDLSKLTAEMVELLEVSISKKVLVEYRLEDDLPLIEGDPGQLRQIVMNLLMNASDAIGDECGTITVSSGTTSLDGKAAGGVFIQIADSGCGMNDEVQSRMFDPFYTTKSTGRGLGLAATLGIVRGHHGTLDVESSPGIGTTIRIVFPQCHSEVESADRTDRKQRTAGDSTASGTVLVVDDDPAVKGLAQAILEAAGFRILTAENGLEGVQIFEVHSDEIEVVLLDLTMPVMGGKEALAEIRRIRPDASVILTSGYQEHQLDPSVGGEIAGFLQKPYRPVDLVGKIEEALGE